MFIKRRNLAKLIENYLNEEDVEPAEEESDANEDGMEDEPAEETPEESEESSPEEETPKEDEDKVEKTNVIADSLKQAEEAAQKGLEFDALRLINLASDALKSVTVKVSDLPDSIKKVLKLQNKKDDEVVDLKSTANSPNVKRLASTKQALKETIDNL